MDVYMKKSSYIFLAFLVCLIAVASCGTQRKAREIKEESLSASIELPKQHQYTPREISTKVKKDTIKVVDFDGKQMFFMKTAVVDGEETASEVLDAAVVTARFRHLAERNGKVNLEFQIIVPEKLMDSQWQLRYQPTMFVLEDSVKLDKVYITGKDYRKKQLRGYQQYQKFLDKIITDPTKLVDVKRLEWFIQRNIPEVYKFKNDTSFVSDEHFEGQFGVTGRQAIDHYTSKFLIKRNAWLRSRRGKMYNRYVKAPIVTEGLRLDTVITINGNYVYNYIQELDVRNKRKLKKVDIVLDGQVYEQGDCIYDIPRTEPLTFYISSLSSFVDGTERYLKKVIERRVDGSASYNIEFATGKYDVVPSFGNNAQEISRIKDQLMLLLGSEVFDLDSVVVVASASPEGSVAANGTLSKNRSESISRYFNTWMKHQIDSLNFEEGLVIDESGEFVKKEKRQPIKFRSRYIPENWDGLSSLIDKDTVMTVTDKEEYYALCDVRNLDERENRMKKEKWYTYMRENLYPNLRSVKFDFSLHRRGMVKDTIETTVLDSTYMDGIQALKDREYELAANLLAPYQDFNTAIAYSALERNHSALSILEREDMEKTAEVYYMLAIIYSRFGDDEKAVQYYMNSCQMNSSFVFRGSLDPEISVLIQRYGLNKEDDSEFGL